MVATLDHAPLFKNHDLIGAGDGGEAVRHNDCCAPTRRIFQSLLHLGLGAAVKR